MKLTLKLERLADAPKANGGASRFPALAWSDKNEAGDGVVHVVAPFHLLFFARARKLHEVLHLVLPAGNEMHDGHAGHLCDRAWHAVRLRGKWHATPDQIRLADALRVDGDSVEV